MRGLLSFMASIISIHGFQLLFVRGLQKVDHFSWDFLLLPSDMNFFERIAFLMFGIILIPAAYMLTLFVGVLFHKVCLQFLAYLLKVDSDTMEGDTILPFLFWCFLFFPLIVNLTEIVHFLNFLTFDQYILMTISVGTALNYYHVKGQKVQSYPKISSNDNL